MSPATLGYDIREIQAFYFHRKVKLRNKFINMFVLNYFMSFQIPLKCLGKSFLGGNTEIGRFVFLFFSVYEY